MHPYHDQADVLTWTDWPEGYWDTSCIYNLKPAAFDVAIARGYRIIIWADSSVYAQANIAPFLERVKSKGWWMGSSGYNGAQTATDEQLAYLGVSRDEAQGYPDAATGLFGINLDNPVGFEFLGRWIRAAKGGAFKSDRRHAGQSADPRFLFGRQDQSVATLIAGKMGMKLDNWGEFVAYSWDKYDSIFKCEGMG